MARFLYFLLLLVLARMAWNAVAGWIAVQARRQMGAPEATKPRTIHKGRMVRDPVCGLYLPEGRAVTDVVSGERRFFCSETCRERFRAELASSGQR